MIDDVEKQIYEVASKFAFVEKAETLLKTPNTIKIKLSITSTCFIQIYQNIQKNVKNYVVVFGNQRLFGRDCDGGAWHEDAYIKLRGEFIKNHLFDINDSETIIKKIIKPSVELYRKVGST